MTIKLRGGVFGRNPTFNDVDVDGTLTVGGNAVPDASTILVDSDIGSTVQGYDADTAKLDTAQTWSETQNFNANTGIGEPSPDTRLHVTEQIDVAYSTVNATLDANMLLKLENPSSTAAAMSGIAFRVGSGADGYLTFVQETGNNGRFEFLNQNVSDQVLLKIYDLGGGIEIPKGNLIIGTSGNGIDFSATAGTGTSELFSDYEQGSWTPAWSFATSGSVTLGSATGTYTKIGDIVYAYCFVSSTSISSPSGQAKITGLPFSATDFVGASFSLVRRFSTSFSANLRGEVAGTEVYFYDHATDSVPATYLEGSDFSSGGNFNQLRFNIVYKV